MKERKPSIQDVQLHNVARVTHGCNSYYSPISPQRHCVGEENLTKIMEILRALQLTDLTAKSTQYEVIEGNKTYVGQYPGSGIICRVWLAF